MLFRSFGVPDADHDLSGRAVLPDADVSQVVELLQESTAERPTTILTDLGDELTTTAPTPPPCWRATLAPTACSPK